MRGSLSGESLSTDLPRGPTDGRSVPNAPSGNPDREFRFEVSHTKPGILGIAARTVNPPADDPSRAAQSPQPPTKKQLQEVSDATICSWIRCNVDPSSHLPWGSSTEGAHAYDAHAIAVLLWQRKRSNETMGVDQNQPS